MDNVKQVFGILGVLLILSGGTANSEQGEGEEIDAEKIKVTFRVHFDDVTMDFYPKYSDGKYVKDFDIQLRRGGEGETEGRGMGLFLELDILSIEGSRLKAKSRIKQNVFTGWQNVKGHQNSGIRIPLVRSRIMEVERTYSFRYEHWINLIPEETLETEFDDETAADALPRVEFMVSRETE